MDSVAPLTPEEDAKYDNIDFDLEVYRCPNDYIVVQCSAVPSTES